jgi:TonB-dependent SusC/RagA subfamily outer membrane receptor
MQKTLLSLIFLAACFLTATAQRQWDRPMQLKKCTINISADPFTAITYIEMEFYNPNDSEIEGLHRFQLQPGQAITAFQLDLYGKFRDGSIEEKWKAANAYNTIVGKRIDPALLQWDGYNSYSLRIYPIAARSTRRVSMTIQQAMKPGPQSIDYLLPLNIADTVEEFSAKVQVGGTSIKPFFTNGLLQGRFSSARGDHQFQTSAHKIQMNKPIAFSLSLLGASDYCTLQKDNTTYFALRYWARDMEYDFSPKKVTVFWDVSASGNTRNVEKEISLLKQYISYYKISQLTIIPFNYRLQDTAVFYPSGSDSRWDNYLRSRQYDGATQLGVIDLSTLKDDAILVFTDGNNSYGRDMPLPGKAYIYCISSNNTNHSHLGKILGESGGRVIDLEKTRISEAIPLMGKAKQVLLDVRSASGKTMIDYQSMLPEAGQLMLAGTLGGFMDTLLFIYGNNNSEDRVEKIAVNSFSSCSSPSLDRLEALMEFDGIVRNGQWDKALAFGRKEKIVTPNTSYIVLERVEDYVRYNIEPPKELEEECLQQGYVKREPVPVKQLTQMDVLRNVTAMYNQWIRMWDSQAAPINPSAPIAANTTTDTKANTAPMAQPEIAKEEPASRADLQEVVVTGMGIERRRELGYSISYRSNDIFRSGFTSIDQVLQGRVAGVQVTATNDPAFSPGNQLSNIRIRGLGSFSNSAPLYVLDGMPVSGSIDNLVNLGDVENITVLKDAQATALYGGRGANGVILIRTKKGSYQRNSYYGNKPYKLKNMEDVDYVKELKQVASSEKISKYRELQQSYGNEPGFYLDAAQHLFEAGYVSEAVAALTNAAEASHGSMPLLKAIAFMLDEWKQYDEAIPLLESMRHAGGGLEAVRNLALAWHRKGNHQKAADLLYEGIMTNLQQREAQYLPLKALMLNDLNAIIATHRDSLNLSAMNKELIRPLPVDLRIVVEGNSDILDAVCMVEPGGNETCNVYNGIPVKTGYFSKALDGTGEYQTITAKKGTYRLRVTYYDHYRDLNVPAVVRITTYRNFGKPNQQVHVQHVTLDNQNGTVEIAEIKW